jgi:hypothetical protein
MHTCIYIYTYINTFCYKYIYSGKIDFGLVEHTSKSGCPMSSANDLLTAWFHSSYGITPKRRKKKLNTRFINIEMQRSTQPHKTQECNIYPLDIGFPRGCFCFIVCRMSLNPMSSDCCSLGFWFGCALQQCWEQHDLEFCWFGHPIFLCHWRVLILSHLTLVYTYVYIYIHTHSW